MHFQWPIKRGKRKASTLEGDITSDQLRKEAGLTKIKATEDLADRIKFADDFFTNVCNHIQRQLAQLMKKTKKSPEDLEAIEILNGYLVNFEAYRAVKKSGMAWSVAGDNREMSERYMAIKTYFTRNWRDPWQVKKILRMAMYLLDISFVPPHVEPAPSIIVQSFPQGTRIDMGARAKTEEVE